MRIRLLWSGLEKTQQVALVGEHAKLLPDRRHFLEVVRHALVDVNPDLALPPGSRMGEAYCPPPMFFRSWLIRMRLVSLSANSLATFSKNCVSARAFPATA